MGPVNWPPDLVGSWTALQQSMLSLLPGRVAFHSSGEVAKQVDFILLFS